MQAASCCFPLPEKDMPMCTLDMCTYVITSKSLEADHILTYTPFNHCMDVIQ